MKNKLSIYLLLVSLIPVIIVFFDLSLLSICISLVSIICAIIFCRKDTRLVIVISFISISCILTNLIYLYNDYKYNYDVYSNTNLLDGTWRRINYSYKIMFLNDNSYKIYTDLDNEDNYCFGSYKYSYGGTSENGNVIKYDKNYLYYDLVLENEYCVNNGIKGNDNYETNYIFGVKKNSKKNSIKEIMFIDKDSKEVFLVRRD